MQRVGTAARPAWSSVARSLAGALRAGESLEPASLDALLAALWVEPPTGVWHPTGFVVLTLDQAPQGALRLHLWPPGSRRHGRPCWPVHDHVWHLRSFVLCGVVVSQGYRVVEDRHGEHCLYAVDYAVGHAVGHAVDDENDAGGEAPARRSVMLRAQQVGVEPEPPRHISAGQRYEVAAGAFHVSQVAAEQLAATLVATEITSRSHPWVVGPRDGPARVAVERPTAERERVQALLRSVQAARA